MNYFIHNIDPVIVHIYGPISIRWYGVAYLLGFLTAYLLLRILSKRGKFQVPIEETGNFIVMMGVFGVIIGGRLGYCLFYGLQDWLKDPLYIFKVWEGGMASHGGIIGVILFILWYARHHHVSFWNLIDNVACVAPAGLFFGRMANFINGELWGRVTTVSWAMIFPGELGYFDSSAVSRDKVVALVENGALQPRHPSQLYEAVGEGLLLFGVLWWLRGRKCSDRPGFLSAAFLFVYAAARIVVEFFREPDSTVYMEWMTKGQLFSFVMLAGGLFLVWSKRLWRDRNP